MSYLNLSSAIREFANDLNSGAAYDAGYPAAYVCDENMVDATPYLHTANDALSTMDFDHLHQHIRLTVGFLVEGSYF